VLVWSFQGWDEGQLNSCKIVAVDKTQKIVEDIYI
jgi:hypothetical protein